MAQFVKQHFQSLFDRGTGWRLHDASFEDCVFDNCALSLSTDIEKRTLVENVVLKNCTVGASTMGPAILRDVAVDGLITDALFILWGPIFEYVVFRGNIGKIKINALVAPFGTADIQKLFDASRLAAYERMDWALDISEARFRHIDVTGVPARLIKRDPETQMVVTRENALRTDWRAHVSPENKLWPFMIDQLLKTDDPDVLMVAPLQGPKKQREHLLRGLHELRELGVAE